MSAVLKKSRASKHSVPFENVHKRVVVRKAQPKVAAQILDAHRIHPITARVLAARGFSPGTELDNFLEPTLKRGLPNPGTLKNLDAACQLIADIIAGDGSIAICCDFDVDGLSGGSQVAHFLQSCGAKVGVFVPDRFEDGYGLNAEMIASISEQRFALMIAIDFGTTNQTELALARQRGIKTIVLDHHHVGGHKPDADVFINPQQDGCGFAGGVLCAAGLAWYLIAGLKPVMQARFPSRGIPEVRGYLDLACLGTICDMVPLIGPNRVIAKRGLELLGSTERPGLKALKKVVGCKNVVNCHDISFGIGPRLNAAGRMVHGEMVIKLLTTEDNDLAQQVAGNLNKLNLERQDTELRVKERAVEQLKGRFLASGLPWGLVAWDEQFHTGVIGIVAQRLVEMFYRPAAVMGLDKEGIFKGSVRGIRGFSVVEALESVSSHLIKFGGHEGAGGFSVKASGVEKFAEAFNAECAKRLREIETMPAAEADTEVSLRELSMDLINELRSLGPFGMGNPTPQLLTRKLRVLAVKQLKSAHLKATLTDGVTTVSGLMWRQIEHPALVVGEDVDVVYRPEVSSFNGVTELQMNLQAVAPFAGP